MIVHCEECGTRYQIDPDRIKGQQARFKCRKCGYLNTIRKPADKIEATPTETQQIPTRPSPDPTVPEPASYSASGLSMDETMQTPPIGIDAGVKSAQKTARLSRLKFGELRLGIELKIIIFFFLPVVFGFIPILSTLHQMGRLSDTITNESADLLTEMTRMVASERTAKQALKIRLHLTGLPERSPDVLAADPQLRALLSERLGRTGLYLLFSGQGADNATTPVIVAAADPTLIGQPLNDVLRRNFGPANIRLLPLLRTSLDGRELSGVLAAPGQDVFYYASAPVDDGKLAVAAVAPMPELAVPVREMKAKADDITEFTLSLNLSILAGTFILIGAIIGLFGNRLANRIKYLTKVADRISVGELETEIRINSKDEIGELAEAISRMQDSLRLSIERLRRKRRS